MPQLESHQYMRHMQEQLQEEEVGLQTYLMMARVSAQTPKHRSDY